MAVTRLATLPGLGVRLLRGLDRRVGTGDPNVSGQAYGFQAFTPVRPGEEAALRAYLTGLDSGDSPFARLTRVHMARFVVVDDFVHDPLWGQEPEEHLDLSYLSFTANSDGDRDDLLDELCERLAPEAGEIWGRCVGCPDPAGGPALKAYLLHNQVECGFFYAAYGGASLGRVREALASRDRLIAFAVRSQGLTPVELQRAFLDELGTG